MLANVAINNAKPVTMLPNHISITGSYIFILCTMATVIRPTSEDAVVAINIGKNTSVGSGAPCCARYIKMVTGSNVSDDEFNTRNSICALLALFGLGLRLCRECIA